MNSAFGGRFARPGFGNRVAFCIGGAGEATRMSDYKVLAEVGQSIINVLWEQIQADPDLVALINSSNLISLESPAEHQENTSDTSLLSVYLYRITEDPYMKNRIAVEGAGGRVRKPPMSLDLYYLITPLLKAPRDQQIVLGKILQILYDRSTLEGPDLAGSLATTGEVVRVVFNAVPLQEVSWVWQALETPYRLSVTYTVRVTMLDSTEEQYQQRVLTQRNSYAQKDDLVGVSG
jgi:Pvc16 N-terminal domain